MDEGMASTGDSRVISTTDSARNITAMTTREYKQQPGLDSGSVSRFNTDSDAMANMTATLLATVSTYIQVFTNLDPSTLEPIQTDDYTQVFAPASLNPPGPFNKAEFASHLLGLREILRSFPVCAKQMWPHPMERQVLVWADSVAEFHNHIVDATSTATMTDRAKSEDEREKDKSRWSYRGEYMFVLSMDMSGTKIQHVLEFLDSKGTEILRSLMYEAKERLNRIKLTEKGL